MRNYLTPKKHYFKIFMKLLEIKDSSGQTFEVQKIF